jgi:hypothetical protein
MHKRNNWWYSEYLAKLKRFEAQQRANTLFCHNHYALSYHCKKINKAEIYQAGFHVNNGKPSIHCQAFENINVHWQWQKQHNSGQNKKYLKYHHFIEAVADGSIKIKKLILKINKKIYVQDLS